MSMHFVNSSFCLLSEIHVKEVKEVLKLLISCLISFFSL